MWGDSLPVILLPLNLPHDFLPNGRIKSFVPHTREQSEKNCKVDDNVDKHRFVIYNSLITYTFTASTHFPQLFSNPFLSFCNVFAIISPYSESDWTIFSPDLTIFHNFLRPPIHIIKHDPHFLLKILKLLLLYN